MIHTETTTLDHFEITRGFLTDGVRLAESRKRRTCFVPGCRRRAVGAIKMFNAVGMEMNRSGRQHGCAAHLRAAYLDTLNRLRQRGAVIRQVLPDEALTPDDLKLARGWRVQWGTA